MFKKILIGAGGGIIFIILNVLANALLARAMGPKTLGQYQVALSAITLITTISAFGIGDATIHALNHLEKERNQVYASVLLLSVFLGAGAFILSWVLFSSNPNYFGHLNLIEATFLSLAALFLIWMAYFRPLLMADLKIEQSILAANLGRLALFIIAAMLLLLKIDTLSGALTAYLTANLITAVVLLLSLEKKKLQWHPETIKVLFSYGIRFGLLNVLVMGYSNISILLLNALHGEGFSDIGIYTRAVTTSNFLTLIPNTLAGLLFARWSSTDLTNILNQFQMTIRVSLSISILSALAIFVFGKAIILILYGSLYLEAVTYLPLLSVSALIGNIALVQRSFIVGQGNIKKWAVAIISATIVLVIGIIILYPVFGLMAAPLALIASNFTLVFISFYHLRQYQRPIKEYLILEKQDVIYIYGKFVSSFQTKRGVM